MLAVARAKQRCFWGALVILSCGMGNKLICSRTALIKKKESLPRNPIKLVNVDLNGVLLLEERGEPMS